MCFNSSVPARVALVLPRDLTRHPSFIHESPRNEGDSPRFGVFVRSPTDFGFWPRKGGGNFGCKVSRRFFAHVPASYHPGLVSWERTCAPTFEKRTRQTRMFFSLKWGIPNVPSDGRKNLITFRTCLRFTRYRAYRGINVSRIWPFCTLNVIISSCVWSRSRNKETYVNLPVVVREYTKESLFLAW